MELWIRSQDKETLTKYDCLSLKKFGAFPNYIIVAHIGNNIIDLGIYETKQRALEVLDEIHQRLINLELLGIAPDCYKLLPKDTSNVYEMPKE